MAKRRYAPKPAPVSGVSMPGYFPPNSRRLFRLFKRLNDIEQIGFIRMCWLDEGMNAFKAAQQLVAAAVDHKIEKAEKFSRKKENAARDQVVARLLDEGQLTHGQIRQDADVVRLNGGKKLSVDALKGIRRRIRQKISPASQK